MNCQRVQGLLLAGPDEPMLPGLRAELQAHLAACPLCRHERDRIGRLDLAVTRWVASAPIASADAIRRRLGTPHARWQAQLRRAVAMIGRAALALTLRGAFLLALALALVGLGASLGVPQARTLAQLGLGPFGGGEATLPVLPVVGNRVWVEAVAPASDAGLVPRPTFQLQLGYTLVSAPEALVSVRLAARPEAQTRYFTDPVRVTAGTNRVVVRFTVDDQWARQLLASGDVQLEVQMRGVTGSGEAPLLAHTTHGRWRLPSGE